MENPCWQPEFLNAQPRMLKQGHLPWKHCISRLCPSSCVEQKLKSCMIYPKKSLHFGQEVFGALHPTAARAEVCRIVSHNLDLAQYSRYFDTQEIRTACPVCLGTYSCRACLTNQSNDGEEKDCYNGDTNLLHYLIHVLLPVIKKVNLDQIIELDIESRIKGKRLYEFPIPQIKSGYRVLPSCINTRCKESSLVKQRSQKSSSRGKNQRVKAVQGAGGCVNYTNIQLSDVSSDVGQVIDSSGICEVPEPEKAVSNSLQHRTAQVAKKVRPNVVALVDSFNHMDHYLGSILGRYDGNLYPKFYDTAWQEPLNDKEVPDGYKEYIRPFLKNLLHLSGLLLSYFFFYNQ